MFGLRAAMTRFFVLILLLHGYIGLRLLPDMAFGAPAIALTSLWLVASVALIPRAFSRSATGHAFSARLHLAGLLAAGSFSSFLLLTLVRDVALLVGFVASPLLVPAEALRQFESASAFAVPVLAALVSLVGFFNARRLAAVRRVDVPIEDLPAALHGFTIVQISDVHFGQTIKRDYVDAIVNAVNDLDADMIAVTGDLVDGSVKQLAAHTAPLARLAARHGAFFVTGNHEYYSGVNAWLFELRRLGLHVLMNEHEVLRHGDAEMIVAGVTDYSAHHFDPSQKSDPAAALAGAPADAAFRLLLAHQPRSAFAAAPAGFDLQLSGHTHGGQFLPWNLFVKFQQPFTAGAHPAGRPWVCN